MTELTKDSLAELIGELKSRSKPFDWPVLDALKSLALEALEMRDDHMFDIGGGRYLCSGGRWHGWEFRKHPDGQFVSVKQCHYEKPLSAIPKVKP